MSINNNQLSAEAVDQLQLWENGAGHLAESGVFRPIHYIGSKLRIIDPIREALDLADPAFGPVCDLFAGSGTVALALASYRRVTAVDIQEFSRIICSALLRPSEVADELVEQVLGAAAEHSSRLKAAIEPLIEFEATCFEQAASGCFDKLCNLVERGSIVGYEMSPGSITDRSLVRAINCGANNLKRTGLQSSPNSLITRYFGGVYFSFVQAAELDALLSVASELPADNKYVFVASVLSTASTVVNTIGKHFAQPIRPRDSSGAPKRHLIRKIRQDRELDVGSVYRDWLRTYRRVETKHTDNTVIRNDYSAMLDSYKGELGAVYADPPYTRDHYSRFYHVLETMSLRDNPEISRIRIQGEDRVSRGLYRVDRHQSPFCIRSQAPSAFAKLFSGVRAHNVPLVLSYSPDTNYEGARPRVMTIDAIRQIALEFFATVDVDSAGSISHSKLNSSDRILGESADAELFFVCKP